MLKNLNKINNKREDENKEDSHLNRLSSRIFFIITLGIFASHYITLYIMMIT